MQASEFKNILYDIDYLSGIVTVTIIRPEIKNASALMVLRLSSNKSITINVQGGRL